MSEEVVVDVIAAPPSDAVAIDPVVTADPVVAPDPAAEPAPTEAAEYTEFTIPEGISLEGDVLDAFKVAAKECGLTQENAQKLIEFGSVANAKALEKVSAQWESDARADKEYGGAKIDENLGIAGKAFDAFASPELKQLLATSKIGNHPEMIRAFYKIGKAMSEDTFVSGSRAPSSSQSAAEKLYGNKG